VRLRPADWLASAQAEGRRLVIASPEAARAGQPVALQVELAGHPARATVFGTARAVRPTPAGSHLEIATAPESLAAVGLLSAAARGHPVSFRERARRFRTSLPAVVGRSVFMVATSVSEGGCSLRWSGTAPQAGEAIRLRIGAGALACELRGVVRWVKSTSAATHVGVRLQPADGHARGWQAQVDQVSRSGAARC
jgi:hypothetical protein